MKRNTKSPKVWTIDESKVIDCYDYFADKQKETIRAQLFAGTCSPRTGNNEWSQAKREQRKKSKGLD